MMSPQMITLPSAPSVSALARLRALPPVAASAQLAPVPGAAAEIENLQAIYGDQARIWRGTEATAAHLTAPGDGPGAWRSVHLVTHGLFNEDRPQYSGLVMQPECVRIRLESLAFIGRER